LCTEIPKETELERRRGAGGGPDSGDKSEKKLSQWQKSQGRSRIEKFLDHDIYGEKRKQRSKT
jgi:hypothetical protein